MKKLSLLLACALAPLTLSACAIIPDGQLAGAMPAAEGAAVGLSQPVRVGDLTVTPIKVVEDSRCPINARCVWAGRLVVETRIDGAGWRDTADITLGETFGTHDRVVALTSGEPGKTTQAEIEPGDYRFTYELR